MILAHVKIHKKIHKIKKNEKNKKNNKFVMINYLKKVFLIYVKKKNVIIFCGVIFLYVVFLKCFIFIVNVYFLRFVRIII